MNTSVNLIKLFIDSNILRQYAVYLQLKHLHSNGCLYKYNVNKLSQKSGLSRNSIKKYVDFFLVNDWCKMHGKNLVFISLTNLRLKYGVRLKHSIKIEGGPVKTILTNLRYELLKQKNRQFNYLKGVSNDLNNPSGKNALRDHKKAIKLSHKYNLPVKGASALKISLKSIGNILNLSSASCFNLIKLKQQQGKAKIIKDIFIKSPREFYGSACKFIEKGYFKGHFYYIPVCNKYEFL